MQINYIDILSNEINKKPEDNKKYIFIVKDEELSFCLFGAGYLAIPLLNNNIKNFKEYINKNASPISGKYLNDFTFMLCSTKDINEELKEILKDLNINYDLDAWKIFNQKDKSISFYKQIKNIDILKEDINKYLDKLNGTTSTEDSFCKITTIGNAYYKNDTQITNFIIDPIQVVSIDGSGTLCANFKTDDKVYELKIAGICFASARRFKEILAKNCNKLYFKGNDNDLEDIKYLYNKKPYPVKTGIRFKGLLNISGKYHFVDNDKTIDSKGNINNNFIFSPEYEVIKTDILKFNKINADELTIISKALFAFNELPKTLIILGFCCSCLVKVPLKEINYKLNHLLLIGEAGSGKSTTIDYIIRPFFSLVNSAFTAKNITKFSAIRTAASSNTIPFILDEFKPYEMNQQQVYSILDLLRNAYDNHTSPRGRTDQSLIEYELSSPIVLAGEAGSNEASIIERSLILNYSKNDVTEESTENILILIKNKDLLSKLGRYILDIALDIKIEKLKELHETADKLFQNKIKDSRIVNSLSNCYIGLKLLITAFKKLEVKIPIDINKVPDILIDYVLNEMLDETKATKTAVEKILEYMDLILSNIDEYNGKYYEIKEKTLYIDLKAFYPIFCQYMQSHNIKDIEILQYEAFTKQLRKTKYFRKYEAYKFKNSKRKKVFYLNIEEFEKFDFRVFTDISFYIEDSNDNDINNPFKQKTIDIIKYK